MPEQPKEKGRKVKVWTLNQATTLLSPSEMNRLCQRLKKQYHLAECLPGDRRMYDGVVLPPKLSKPAYALMLEDGPFYSEYFVPIDVKCLGDLLQSHDPKLEPIRKYHHRIGRKVVLDFWKKDSPNRMFTREGLGYLSILRKERSEGYEAVLIGYSQGGTVARYLAVLDRLLYPQNPAIVGLATLAAPLKGSPFARPQNKQTVVDAILGALLSLTPLGYFKDLVEEVEKAVDFEDLQHLMWKLIKKSAVLSNRKLTQTLLNLSKWLGGLAADVNNAFYDLNPETAHLSGSVLNQIERPLSLPSLGILTAGGRFGNLLNELLYAQFKGLHFLWDWIFKRHTFRKADMIYQKGFVEQPKLPPFLKEWTQIFQRGCKTPLKMPAEAHDFIIPSFYQFIADPNSKWVLNLKATHFTGFMDPTRGGSLMLQTLFAKIKIETPMAISKRDLQNAFKKFRKRVRALPHFDWGEIEQTARRLQLVGFFETPWIEAPAGFVFFQRKDVLRLLDRILKENKPQDRIQKAERIVRAFEFLCRLRKGDEQAWETVEKPYFAS